MSERADQVVDECLLASDDGADSRELLLCIAQQFAGEKAASSFEFTRTALLIYSTALVFFMQAGFAMLCAGAVRTKNVQNSMMKNLLDACGAALAFYAVGYAFAFGGDDPTSAEKTFIGTQNFFLMGVDDMAFWLFQYAFSAASATIVAGTLAERCQMAAYLNYAVLLCGFVYPVIAHAVWSRHGFLSSHSIDPLWGTGLLDFAGSGVVHMTGGTTALFATMILGPRRGRFHDDTGQRLSKPRELRGHSVALQMLGTFTLWFGWYAFNAGSALVSDTAHVETVLALSGVNTTLAGGAGGIAALFMNLYLLERSTGEPFFDLKYLMNGTLSGLVAITGGCGLLEPWAAVLVGLIAGLLYILGSHALIRYRLDDAVDAIPVHMINGAWGLLAVGLFGSPHRIQDVYNRSEHVGFFYSFNHGGADALLLGTQIIGVLFIFGFVMFIMLPFFIWLDYRGWFRSDPLDEIVGLDTSYHGGFTLIGGHSDEFDPEYISAYRKRKQQRNSRRSSALNEFIEESGEEYDSGVDSSAVNDSGVSDNNTFEAALSTVGVDNGEDESSENNTQSSTGDGDYAEVCRRIVGGGKEGQEREPLPEDAVANDCQVNQSPQKNSNQEWKRGGLHTTVVDGNGMADVDC